MLTLGNDLTGTVSREVDAAGRKANGLGESMVSGNNKFVAVVDGFLGNSLRDSELILTAVAKNTNYMTNALSAAKEYLSTTASSLQEGLKNIGSAGQISAAKLVVLQQNLDDKKTQINLLIKTADFDGKSLLAGGIKKLDVQVGLNQSDKITTNITDISGGKLFRSTVTNLINDYVKADAARSTHYANATELATDSDVNNNLVLFGMTDAGAGGGGAMTDGEVAAAIVALRTANPNMTAFLNDALTTGLAAIEAANAGETFADALVANVEAAVTADRVTFLLVIADNAATDISDPDNKFNRLLAQDVFTAALNTVRAEEASVSNQISNIVEASEALRQTTNVTEKAADSYLKTDYVLTAQQYSETIRTMVSAITALQAANKIPEAAQRLVDSLAR